MRRLSLKIFLIFSLLFLPACFFGGGNPPNGNPDPTPGSNADSPLGTNLGMVRHWSSEIVFKDSFKQSEAFFSGQAGQWSDERELDLDENGYVRSLLSDPSQIARSLMHRELDDRNGVTHYQGGTYIFLYDGFADENTFNFRFDADEVSYEPGRIVLEVTPSGGGILLEIQNIPDSDNYPRNFRLFHSQYENDFETNPFYPGFLAINQYYSTLRFSNWMSTRNSINENWEDRTTPESQTQAGDGGVAVEYMVQLANTLQIDPWFSMPHLATDDYVTQLATYVRDHLDPNLKAYVEYSNEVWNWMFEQTHYAEEQGQALGFDPPYYLHFYAYRSVQIFQIWESVFGGTERIGRLLAGQNSVPWAGLQIMNFISPGETEPASFFADYYAVAPYFSGPNLNPQNADNDIAEVLQMTPEEIITTFCIPHIPITIGYAGENRQNAQARGLELISYEGGQHLVGVGGGQNIQELTDLLMETNRHPMMGEAYTLYLNSWRELGGQLLMHFLSVGEWGMWGSWGSMEYMDEYPEGTPKYNALQSFIANNPIWW